MRETHADVRLLTVAEYLALEENAHVRHEYVRGEVYAMSGTTARHNLIAQNIVARLRHLARGGPCKAYIIDLKVRAARDIYYCPDGVVVCQPHDGATIIFDNPCLLVEVSSPSTARTDRGEKLEAYRQIASLRAYLIVGQDRRYVTIHLRGTDGEWSRVDLMNSGSLAIPCPSGELTLDQIYEDVDMPPLHVRELPEEGWLAPDELIGR